MPRHLIFYDGECGLCDRVVQFVTARDPQRQFAFAPLGGETAERLLGDLSPEERREDTVILIENFETEERRHFLLGRAALRILWHIGGGWRVPGAMAWLPPPLYNWGYRLVARHRHRLFPQKSCVVPDVSDAERFLP